MIDISRGIDRELLSDLFPQLDQMEQCFPLSTKDKLFIFGQRLLVQIHRDVRAFRQDLLALKGR